MKCRSTVFTGLLTAFAFTFLTALPARATLEVKITDSLGTTAFTVPNCPGNCIDAAVSDADFSIVFEEATSNGPTGPATLHVSGLIFTNPLATLPEDLLVQVSDVGFLSPHGPGFLVESASTTTILSPTATGTFAATGFYKTGNTYLCAGATLGAAPTIGTCNAATPAASFSSFTTNPVETEKTSVSFSTPFSLDEVLNYHFTGPGFATTSATLSAALVPEPASVLLFGGILLLTAGLIRKRIVNQPRQ